MKLEIYKRLNGQMVLGDADDDAPMVIVELCNEFATRYDADELKMEMLKSFMKKLSENIIKGKLN